MSLNRWTAIVFSLILIGTGAAGFLPAPASSAMSAAPWYNIFHLVFGLAGLLFFFWGGELGAKTFNVGFGVLDLYQGVAALAGWFPRDYFLWKPTDTVVHFVLGVILVVIGLTTIRFGKKKQ